MISRRTLLTSPVALSLWGQTRLRPGCQTRAYGSPIRDKGKLLAALDDIAATGYEGFETNFASLEHSFDNPGSMKDEFARRNLVLIGLHASPRLAAEENLAAEIAKAMRIVRATKAMGGSLLVASSSGVPRDAAGAINRAVLDVYTRNLNRFGAQCRDEGIRLAVHNHAKELANGGEELHAVMAACDAKNVGALMDVSFFVEAGLPPHQFIRKYASRLAGVHLRDMKNGIEVEVGQGNLDLPALASALRDALHSGWLILEMNKREDMTSKEMITRNRARMKQHLGV